MMGAEPLYRIDTLKFDGPLDLLLKLLRKNKVDIYDIPIAAIADQYLDFVAALPETDPEVISSFIVMAATLMDIKARMLVPGSIDDTEDESDPREELVRRLEAYEHTRLAAERLRLREKEAARFMYSRRELPRELKDVSAGGGKDMNSLLNGITAESLHALYEELAARMKRAQNERALDFGVIRRDRASLAACVAELTRFASSHGRFRFSDLIGKRAERPEVVVQFLALLELARLGHVSVRQKKAFGEINVEVVDQERLGELDLTEVLDV